MKRTPQERMIVALDVDSVDQASKLVKSFVGVGVTHFKVGLSLFTQAGPAAIEAVHRGSGQVFLDLKFHDIPNTVGKAVQAATRLSVWMMNLHIQGGSVMMRQAIGSLREEARRQKSKPPLLIGVTVLTSMAERDLADLGLRKTLKDQVLYLSKLAQSVGLDGIVASAKEATTIRWACGSDFLIVTPGIRPADVVKEGAGFPGISRSVSTGAEDQQRTTTPTEALKAGADYLVVGRPILAAPDPVAALQHMIEELRNETQ